MERLKARIIWGFNLGVFIPTLFYFSSLYFYGFMTLEELIASFTTPRAWMLFVLIYYPLLNVFLNRKLALPAKYLENPDTCLLPQVQKRIASLPRIFIFNVMIYATTGACSLILFENFFTDTERVLGLLLGFAFTFVYALPFFVGTVMKIERWTASVPYSEKYPFLTVKGKLYINLFCNVLGVIVVISVLNLGFITSNAGMDAESLFGVLLQKNLILGFLCLLIVIVNVWMLSKQLIDPIKKTTELIKEISEGDLTQEIDVTSKDEIGILNYWSARFVEKIQDVITQVRQSAGHLDTSAETLVSNIDQISMSMSVMGEASNQIATEAEGTSGTISDVVESVNFMEQSISAVANHSQKAFEQGSETVAVAQEGQRIVVNTIEKMDEIYQEMKYLVKTIEKMGNSVIQIEEIVKMISEIARKTNLLALNASIEAARVGAEGKGFMVVAQSIGNLSEESHTSVTEIVQLVDEIRKVASGSIDKTREGMEKVEKEMEWVKKTGEAFDQIFSGIRQTTDTVQVITESIEQQSKESKKITNSIREVNEMALHVSALVEEQVATTEEIVAALTLVNSSSDESTSQMLIGESKELYKIISQFKV